MELIMLRNLKVLIYFFRYKVGDTITEYVDCTKGMFYYCSGKVEKARQNINKIKDNIKIK